MNNKRDMCINCRNKSIGCEKFCEAYKGSFNSYLYTIMANNRIAQREREIALRLKKGAEKKCR